MKPQSHAWEDWDFERIRLDYSREDWGAILSHVRDYARRRRIDPGGASLRLIHALRAANRADAYPGSIDQ